MTHVKQQRKFQKAEILPLAETLFDLYLLLLYMWFIYIMRIATAVNFEILFAFFITGRLLHL